jgi:hypothetical protein
VAERHRGAALSSRAADPWTAMFAEAARNAKRGPLRDIEPYWVYDGAAHNERHLPLLPLSRDAQQFVRLRRSLAAYRLVFGQPRQEDLVAYLGEHVDPEQLAEMVNHLRIDLFPK